MNTLDAQYDSQHKHGDSEVKKGTINLSEKEKEKLNKLQLLI